MSEPANAPGCFAAASVFSHDSDVCRKCVVFADCSAASLDTLEKIRHLIDVSDLLRRHEKAKRATRQALAESDEKLAAHQPPGNIQPPPTGVKRKTEVAKITFEVSEDEERVIAMLSSKVKPIAVTFCKTGMLSRVKKELREGRNALAETGPGWLRVAVDLLLRGGFTRSELRKEMQCKLGWGESSTGPHTSMAVSLLVGFGIAINDDNRFVLAPESV